jgi:glycosyltransferase involved in cell wall biosynthesis
MTKLSIIVPVYNVERYIRPCIESVYRQGLDDSDFEIIIVNDGTPDRSMEMIADILAAHQNITVINQENQGLSMARNNAMKVATGEYIQFLDSDDLLIDNSLPYLLNNAISSKADLVVADFITMNDEQIAQFDNKFLEQKDGTTEEKSGRQLLIQDLNPYYCNVWHALHRKEFVYDHQLRFIPGICYEDVPFSHECYLKANQCLRVNWQFVIYRIGHESITSTFTFKKAMDYCVVITSTWALSCDTELDEAVKQKIRDNVFVVFSWLFYLLTTNKHISRAEKMSVLKKIKDSTPDLSFKNGVKQIIVNFLYQNMPDTYMTLRIFYANHLQHICWAIGDFIRNKKTKNSKSL